MAAGLNRQLKAARQHLDVLSKSPALRSPDSYLAQRRKDMKLLENRLISAENNMLSRRKQQYIGLTAKLDAMSPLKVLTRGYAMAQTDRGEVLRSVSQVENDDTITVTLSDGRITAAVTGKENGQ